MHFYYISVRGRDYNTAAIKAPKDIETILKGKGYTKVSFWFPSKFGNSQIALYISRIASVLNWTKAIMTIRKNSLVVIQYPYGCKRMFIKAMPFLQKHKNVKIVLLLHDIDSLRGYSLNSSLSSEKMIKLADYVICHNARMKSYLIDQGIKEERLYTLGVFDYLCDNNFSPKILNDTIALAGNLSPRKSPYIDKFLKMNKNFSVNVYGPNYEAGENNINTNYCGQFGPDEIPLHICGNWGLVWDGDSLESCTGETGNYLRYNNPHKLSLYIASGIPVIIWEEAALADYVKEKKIGITVSSLRDIESAIFTVSDKDYAEILYNVKKEAINIRNGWNFKTVLAKIENKVL